MGIVGHDPLLDDNKDKFGIEAAPNLKRLQSIDCVIITVVSAAFRDIKIDTLKSIMNDTSISINVR